MKDKKSIPYLLSIIILLVICSATSIGYIIGISKIENVQKKNVIPFSTENEIRINSEITKLKSIYYSKIEEKKTNYKELEIEKRRVQELLMELDKVKGNENLLLKYKEQYQNLENKMRLMVNEIAVLKSNKVKAMPKTNVTKSKIVVAKTTTTSLNPVATKYIYLTPKKEVVASNTETLIIKNKPIEETKISEHKTENTAAELNVTNLETIAYKINSNSRHEITNIASKVNFIRISFTIFGNSNIKTVDKKYYIQIINSKNNVLGIKTTEYFEGKTLTYSAMKTIQYEGQNIQVIYELAANKFVTGNYFISIYDRSKLMAKTSFVLQ